MAKDSLKISPEQASKILGISPNKIREDMRRGELPIGHVRKGKKYRRKTGPRSYVEKTRCEFDIYKPLVLEYVGLKEWPEGV